MPQILKIKPMVLVPPHPNPIKQKTRQKTRLKNLVLDQDLQVPHRIQLKAVASEYPIIKKRCHRVKRRVGDALKFIISLGVMQPAMKEALL